MQHKFKTGDKVKCIDTDNGSLLVGKIYVVEGISDAFSDKIYVISEQGYKNFYYATRFELANDKTDLEKAFDLIGKKVKKNSRIFSYSDNTHF